MYMYVYLYICAAEAELHTSLARVALCMVEILRREARFAVCCSVLQCVAVCCSVLQCVAVCCSVLQSLHIGMTALHRKK